jgi:patatin-like phospholipase/acyl hydrolase
MSDVTPDRPVTVLAIDGGGIRGLIPALVLAELEERAGQPLWTCFDLAAGTSTGGLLALGLTAPDESRKERARYPARRLARLYTAEGARIFDRSLWRTARTAVGLLEEKYPADGLEAVLQEYFGGAPLSSALTEVLVPSYALERREAYFFKRHKARRAPDAHDVPMRAAARATSAAPTYFEPARVSAAGGRTRTLVDGGVFAGNPAMCAYVEAVARFPEARGERDVLVVSLGTGAKAERIPYRHAADWGVAGWGRPLIDVFLHGARDTVDYQLRRHLPATNYVRFEARLAEAGDALDDAGPGNLSALRRDAERLIDKRSADLDALAERLVERVDG